MMPDSESVRERNQKLADRINQEPGQNPDSPDAGKFVGIADGQVMVVAEALRETVERSRQAEPAAASCFSLGEECFDEYSHLPQLPTICEHH